MYNKEGLNNKIIYGDCGFVMQSFPDSFVDLIFTSPPYADQRINTYGGIKPDDYVKWFLPKAQEFKRVLKDDGTFIINIKERVVDGERHTYVLSLIQALREQGWFWTEEYIWHKKNSHPGRWPNRFRDSWERLLQFNKNKIFYMDQDAVMVPVGDWAKSRLSNLSEKDKHRDNSAVGSGFGKRVSAWLDREMVYPTNVLYMATECGNKNHSAAFPLELPSWFIKLFTQEGGMVLDPFIGSGTTALAALSMGRRFIGIDVNRSYVDLSINRLSGLQMPIRGIAEETPEYEWKQDGEDLEN